MTENTTQYTPGGSPAGTYTYPQPAPQKPNFFKRHWLIITVGVVALGLGSGIGAAGKPEPVTIEKQVPGPERVVTKTVEVPKTPAACLTALELNEEAFGGLSESLKHVSNLDYAAAKASTAKVSALVPKVNAAKSACRAAQ